MPQVRLRLSRWLREKMAPASQRSSGVPGSDKEVRMVDMGVTDRVLFPQPLTGAGG